MVEAEFLAVVRACRDSELGRLRSAFAARSSSGSSRDSSHGSSRSSGRGVTVILRQLPGLFEEALVTDGEGPVPPSLELLEELAASCGLRGRAEVSFTELCLLRERLRQCFGFSRAEVEEAAEAFGEHDFDRSGSVDRAGTLGALRWLSLRAPAAAILDAEGQLLLPGQLDFREFLRVALACWEAEVGRLRAILAKRPGGRVPEEEVPALLVELGYSAADAEVDAAGGKEGAEAARTLGLPEVMRRLTALRRRRGAAIRERGRQSWGFNDLEVAHLRSLFQQRDPDGVGVVTGEDLEVLLGELPRQHSRHAAAEAKVLLRRVGQGIWGRVSFRDFLRVARLLQDHGDLERLRRERRAVEEAGLAPAEVEGFRSVFRTAAWSSTGAGTELLSFGELRDMLAGVVPFGRGSAACAAADADVRSLLDGFDDCGEGCLDFPEFLGVMRRVRDEDWHSINGAAAAIAMAEAEGSRATLARRSPEVQRQALGF